MSGHSKWSTIKRQKGANDAKRGQAFTKAGRLITIAARDGGGNPDGNFKLRLAIEAARTINMPKENIERAIAKGAGGDGLKPLEEAVYEGYGPNGVALLIEVVTDNKMRTASEIRSILDRSGGSLAGPGSVAFLFKSQGVIEIDAVGKDPDELLLTAADSGAEDVEVEDKTGLVYTKPDAIEKVKMALTSAGYEVKNSEVSKEPTTTVKINDENQAGKVLGLVEKLEELDDVQKVYGNFDIDTEVMEKIA